ncbi:MAG TPA: peptidoglycan bridge formation glycyltransferase FemA/FemB family protein [Candidatus Gracilibacteria bacterium]|nr:peptidoglycan bridge formation glycyltransferase FemA/FemB family protein [Candidatus Gracilibacteria bacterium]
MNAHDFQILSKKFSPSLWQTWEWSEFQRQLGHEVVFLGHAQCLSLGIIKPLNRFFKYLELPRGPLGHPDAEFWQEVKKIAKTYHCIMVSFSPSHPLESKPKRVFPSVFQHFPCESLFLDLSQNEEELLKQMKPKGRYNIRIAQRHQIKIQESKDVNLFYPILAETTKRDHFKGHNPIYYQKMLNTFGDNAKMYLAYYFDEISQKSEIIAGGIFIFTKDTAIYYYGASSDLHRDKMAPYLIQWQAIQEAKKRQILNYDFLGIAPENEEHHPLNGVSRFKRQFGGREVNYPSVFDFPLVFSVYLLYWIYRFIRKYW